MKYSWKNLKKDPIAYYFIGKNRINSIIVLISILPGILAAFMEGISYGSLMLAVNVLRGDPVNTVPIFTFMGKLIQNLSQNRKFLFFIILSLLIQFIRSSFIFLSQYIVSRLSLKITAKIQCKIYKQIFNFTYPYVSKYQTGDLLSYTTAPNVIPGILMEINSSITAITMGFISFLCLFKIDKKLTLVLLIIFFSINGLYKLILKKVNKLSINLTSDEVKFSAQASQNFNGIKLIHIFNRQNLIINRIRTILINIASATTKITFWRTLISSFGEIIGIVIIALMLITGAFILHNRDAFISYLLMFIFIAYRLSIRLQIFMMSLATIISSKGALLRLRKILNDKDKEYINDNGKDFNNFNKHIKFHNIIFYYDKRKTPALNDFSYIFEKGKTYAIVGRSGAGKSTLIDLLLRLFEPIKGKITIDDQHVVNLSLNSWRKLIGVVSQDVFIFNDTIEENIRFGKLSATKNEIIEAAKTAGIHNFIKSLPNKYQNVIGERGYSLSGGEKQRLSLARALVRNPEILVLDEATSQLDSHSERIIQNAIEKIRKDKTIIIIAHRLSTITTSDKILVIENGKLIESGSHSELLEKNNKYAYFWNIQSKTDSEQKKDSMLKNLNFF